MSYTKISMENKKTVVFGASLKSNRYSNIAIHHLINHNYPCVGLGLREGHVKNIKILLFGAKIDNVHTITLYMNAKRQEAYMDEILAMNPKRIIFNPGAENETLYMKAKSKNIEVENACTLVLLSTGAY